MSALTELPASLIMREVGLSSSTQHRNEELIISGTPRIAVTAPEMNKNKT